MISIISKDKRDTTYLYYQNGFVEITADGWKLRSYEEMDGSVWEHQMLKRKFTPLKIDQNAERISETFGYFGDFRHKLSNEDTERFKSLCTIIGHIMHDFYEYKLSHTVYR